MMFNNLKTIVALIWQVPLSLISFLFLQTIKWVFRKIAKKKYKDCEELRWIGFSELLNNPELMTYLSAVAPRWNCHAVLGNVGPFIVKSSVEINVEKARQSAKRWSFTFYRGGSPTNLYLDSNKIEKDKEWYRINLRPGRYNLVLRYYDCEEVINYPAVKLDGMDKIKLRSMNDEMENYQSALRHVLKDRNGYFSYYMHYYIFHLLRWKKYISDSIIKNQYLPVGDQGTIFYYGSMNKGDTLYFNFRRHPHNNWYITFFNRCSFPVFWEKISQINYQKAIPCDGTYLIRIGSRD